MYFCIHLAYYIHKISPILESFIAVFLLLIWFPRVYSSSCVGETKSCLLIHWLA